MADIYDVREIVTGKFYERHVVLVRAPSATDLTEDQLDEVAKKVAETVYQSRDVAVSTVVVLGMHEAMSLKSEVKRRQNEYENAPARKEFSTLLCYPLYGRGTKEGTPAAKKRATFQGLCHFKYGVVAVKGEHGPKFKIDHYGGVR
jgi:hypothetical protein